MDKIKKILAEAGVNIWKIIEQKIDSKELFMVEMDIDMNRSKEVTHYILTVYADFEEDGIQYRGSANTHLSPSMSDEEILEKIKTAYFAAGFVKNKWYPLVKPSTEKGKSPESAFAAEDVLSVMKELYSAVYEAEGVANHINATEFFVEKYNYRVVNSEGVDIQFRKYKGEIEVVTHAESPEIKAEVCRIYDFADSKPAELKSLIEGQMQETNWRKEAKKASDLENIPVILSNDAVSEFFEFYYGKASASAVYQKISQAKIGESLQGKPKADQLNMTLMPLLNNSSASAGYDSEGTLLKDIPLFKDGVLLTYHGNNQYSHYLGVEPTGHIANFKVEAGSMGYSEMIAKPHIEVLVFSDFQMDDVTGDFGGEVRLARYFDGKAYHSVTGLSMASSITKVQENMYFSKEMIQYNTYYGPAHIYFPELRIS